MGMGETGGMRGLGKRRGSKKLRMRRKTRRGDD